MIKRKKISHPLIPLLSSRRERPVHRRYFSRYTSAVSGDLSIGVSPFIASYTIEDISSNTYTNANFWINATGHQQGTARSVRFSFRNYATREDGSVLRVSDVPLTAHLRVEIPAEFADRLVLQVASDDGESAVMPQIVLGNLIYQVSDAPQTHYMDGVPEDYYDYITSAQNGNKSLRPATILQGGREVLP